MNFAAILPTTSNLVIAIILLIVGLVCIIKGGDFFVDASVWVAEVLKMPKFLIGATIVSIATTLPEMIVSIIAVVEGNLAISVGNAVGSVTANTGLILAISAIFVSCSVERRDFGIKSILIIASTLIILLFTIFDNGKFGYIPSILSIIVLIYYMYETAISAKKNQKNTEDSDKTIRERVSSKTIALNICKFVAGAAGIILGADLLVSNASFVASEIGVSDGIIAITIVAIGTSLPELITTITSIVKKQGDLGVGNIVGANIIDLTLILPVCSIISGGNLVVEPQNLLLDIPACLIISAVAVIPALIFKKFTKIQGVILLVLYITYVVLAATLKF